jgi:hypothetical protein
MGYYWPRFYSYNHKREGHKSEKKEKCFLCHVSDHERLCWCQGHVQIGLYKLEITEQQVCDGDSLLGPIPTISVFLCAYPTVRKSNGFDVLKQT